MITRRILTPLHTLSLVVVALALLVATPVSAAAASSEHVGAGVVVAIPGPVALLTYLTAGLVVLALMVARRRPMV